MASFAAAPLLLYLCGASPYLGRASPVAFLLVAMVFFLLFLLGTSFGISCMRTWRGVYRGIMLAALVIVAGAFYLSIVLAGKY